MSASKGILWEAKLDGVYRCLVIRLDSDEGTLYIYDNDGNVIFKRIVSLSYGAVFGPDVDDIAEWQNLCAEAIDSLTREG